MDRDTLIGNHIRNKITAKLDKEQGPVYSSWEKRVKRTRLIDQLWHIEWMEYLNSERPKKVKAEVKVGKQTFQVQGYIFKDEFIQA